MSTDVSNLGVEMSWKLVLRKRQTRLGGTRLPHIEQLVVPSPGVAVGVREFFV
jgi:hypothetical protein